VRHEEILPVVNPAWGRSPSPRVDVSRYVSREYVALERERLWPHVWQIACREEEISGPGDYFEYEIGDQSIIVVRTSKGEVKAFFNACLHRGTQLAKGCGTLRQFTCPFHAWRWSLDGAIRYVHDRADFPGLTDEELRLPECQVGLFAGFVFIKMTEGGESLEAFLAPIADNVAAYRIEDYRIQSWRTVVVKANWKVALEAFEESYHILGTHPQGRMTGADVGTIYDSYGPHTLSIIPTGLPSPRFSPPLSEQALLKYMIDALLDVQLADETQRALFEELREKPLPDGLTTREFFQKMAQGRFGSLMPDLTPDQYTSVWDYTFFPNFVFNATPGNIFGFLARPNGDDPDSCVFDVVSLQHPCGKPGEAVKRQRITDPSYNWGTALSQDWSNLERIQKGMHARTMQKNRLASYQESRIANRVRVMDHMMAAHG